MKRVQLSGLIVLLFACALRAQPVSTTFTYKQTDATTGSGTISGFVVHATGGDITFAPTPMPSALVINPGTGQFVGKQTAQSGNSNEPNSAVGLSWSGSVTATGTRGSEIYTVQIPLKFVPKVTQSPDSNDYNWNVLYGDDSAGGNDVVSTVSPRFAVWLSRDDVVDAAETAGTFQRYTQLNNQVFTTGPNSFTNTETTTTAFKDAQDSGDPQGTDAVGRNLAFYFGWRDQGTFAPSVIMVDDFQVGGLLNPDMTTFIPEPGTLTVLAAFAAVGFMRRRRA
jgi:hypothetical protein